MTQSIDYIDRPIVGGLIQLLPSEETHKTLWGRIAVISGFNTHNGEVEIRLLTRSQGDWIFTGKHMSTKWFRYLTEDERGRMEAIIDGT
jgi:hypothetical protein